MSPYSKRGSEDRLRTYVLAALMAGAAAAGGYLLMAVPNVEVFTAILFIAGYALGAVPGMTAAVAAAVLYFGLNPQGGLFPPLFAAQVVGAGAAPLAGTWFAPHQPLTRARRIRLAVAGGAVTVWYDLLTNLAYPLAAGFDLRGIAVTVAMGVPFSVVHVVSNLLIFLVLVPNLLAVVDRRRLRSGG